MRRPGDFPNFARKLSLPSGQPRRMCARKETSSSLIIGDGHPWSTFPVLEVLPRLIEALSDGQLEGAFQETLLAFHAGGDL